MFHLPRISRGTSLTLVVLLTAAFALALLAPDAAAFQRKVLFEDFTSTTCPPCAAAAPAVEAALEDVTTELCSPIAYHVWWPGAGNDPWCLANRADNEAKVNHYGVRGVPTYLIDGTVYNGARTAAAFAAAIRQRAQTASPLRINLSGRLVGDVIQAHVEVTAESQLQNVTLNVALNEGYYEYNAPTGQRDHYDAMIKMLPNAGGTRFNINANQTLSWDFEANIRQHLWHEVPADNMILLAWVQSGNQEVYQSQNYHLGYDTPMLQIKDWTLTDEDGDGRSEIGETTSIVITLENLPDYLTAETYSVELTTEDAGITIVNGVFEGENLEPRQQVTNRDNPLTFRVNEGFQAHPVAFNLVMSAQPGDFSDSYTMEFMVEWPPFLVVDASSNQRAGDMVMQNFGDGDLPWADKWDRVADGYLTGDILGNYDFLLWHSFNNQDDPINEFEIDVLAEYLRNGGNLVFSSNYAILNLGNNAFFSDYLGVSLNEANTRANYIQGIDGEPDFDGSRVFLGGGDGAGFPAAKPTLNAVNGGVPAMYYDNAGQNAGWAAVKKNGDNYRTLTFGFPLESIGGVAGTESFAIFLERVWHWATNPSSVPGSGPTTPAVFSLSPAFPNPFNPATVIPFSLERASQVNLGVFDLAGRQVASLVNGNLSAGAHTVQFDAGGAGLTGGIYIIRLDAGASTASSKLLYLK